MLSYRLILMLNFLTNLGQRFGAHVYEFNVKTNKLTVISNTKRIARFQRIHSLLCFWAVASFALVAKCYFERKLGKFYLKSFFWITGATMVVACSVARNNPCDGARCANDCLVHMKFLQGRLYQFYEFRI